MIAVCNTLAYNNSRSQADIDLFIVSRRGRIWQTRFWVAGFLQLFKLRPQATKIQNKFCTSFFVDEDNLNLESLAISHDIYLPFWLAQLMPVYDDGIYQKFLSANAWIKNYLPNSLPIQPPARRFVKGVGWLKRLLEAFFTLWPEPWFKNFQLKIIPESLKILANCDSRVVINDGVLKFHGNDRRQLFLEKWQGKMKGLM